MEKKLFFMHINKTKIYKECETAHNEMKMVVFYQNFNLYDGVDIEMPYCLTLAYAYVNKIVGESYYNKQGHKKRCCSLYSH